VPEIDRRTVGGEQVWFEFDDQSNVVEVQIFRSFGESSRSLMVYPTGRLDI